MQNKGKSIVSCFNADTEKFARFISETSRRVRYIKFDDPEQIEDAPEYEKR